MTINFYFQCSYNNTQFTGYLGQHNLGIYANSVNNTVTLRLKKGVNNSMINLSSKISGIPTSAFAEIKIINVKNVATGANLPVDVNNNSFRLDYRNSGN